MRILIVEDEKPLARLLAEVLERAGQAVTLRVGNTGPGIAPEDAAHVFDRFFRSAHTAEIPGSGLGLSLARELARAMGGDLAPTTTRPGWTEFTLKLRMTAPRF